MRDTLPLGWTTVKLNDLISLALGGDWGNDPKQSSDGFRKVKVVRGTDFRNWRHDKGTSAAERLIKLPSLEKRRLQKNDIVLEVSGGGPDQPVGRTILIDDEALRRAQAPLVCSNFFRLLRLHREVNSAFVNHYLTYEYRRGAFNEYQTQTTNLRNLNVPNFLEQTNVALAPFREQECIAAKLDTVLAQIDECQKRLVRMPIFLKRFRQSVLTAACSGRLTVDWRQDQPNGALAGDSSDQSDSLPSHWKSVCVGDVIDNLRYGTSTKCSYTPKGVPVLRIPNVLNGMIDHTDLKFAQLPTKELEQLRLQVGDILIIRSNGSVSLVGKSALVRTQDRGLAYAGYLIRLRPIRDQIESEFLNFVLSSFDVRVQIELQARSTSGVNNINSEEVRALRFLLPPLPEQREIIRRVNDFFGLADSIEARYKRAQQLVDHIPQSVLSKAFQGQLVPAEAELAEAEGRSFESAEELLRLINSHPQRTVRGKEDADSQLTHQRRPKGRKHSELPR